MAKREVKYDPPKCGYCGKLTRSVDQKSRNRVCEKGHRIVVKRGARH